MDYPLGFCQLFKPFFVFYKEVLQIRCVYLIHVYLVKQRGSRIFVGNGWMIKVWIKVRKVEIFITNLKERVWILTFQMQKLHRRFRVKSVVQIANSIVFVLISYHEVLVYSKVVTFKYQVIVETHIVSWIWIILAHCMIETFYWGYKVGPFNLCLPESQAGGNDFHFSYQFVRWNEFSPTKLKFSHTKFFLAF